MNMIRVITYITVTGKEPLVDWLDALDKRTKQIILARIARLRLGNLGDCKSIKGASGICELRIDYGSGYRVYFGRKGIHLIVLLIGGDKGSQIRDIEKAKKLWLAYKDSDND